MSGKTKVTKLLKRRPRSTLKQPGPEETHCQSGMTHRLCRAARSCAQRLGLGLVSESHELGASDPESPLE